MVNPMNMMESYLDEVLKQKRSFPTSPQPEQVEAHAETLSIDMPTPTTWEKVCRHLLTNKFRPKAGGQGSTVNPNLERSEASRQSRQSRPKSLADLPKDPVDARNIIARNVLRR